MMPEVTKDPSQHKEKLTEILPDAWPMLQDGPMRCQPWVAALWDAPNALLAEAAARDLKRVIERGGKAWRSFKIDWTKEQLESVLKKIPLDCSADFC